VEWRRLVKRAYAIIAQRIGIDWNGRNYDRARPEVADQPNQAINHAVTALESCVSIAVQATATLPPLGFLHEDSGKSFILDLCDLYRTTVTVPIAFSAVKNTDGTDSLDRRVRLAVSRHIRSTGFVDTVIDDIKELLSGWL
jgi:CRISPR-associated protein Cas1